MLTATTLSPTRLAVVCLVLLGACSPDLRISEELLATCTGDRDCPSYWVCLRSIGTCQRPEADCVQATDAGYDVAPPGAPCGNVDAGTICIAGACVSSSCGDGYHDADAGEGCDLGSANTDGALGACRTNCQPPGCGDGVFDQGELCDDGNTVDGDGCDTNCTPTGCGNGVIAGIEGCDDGNVIDGDGCDSNCTSTSCGNGVVTPPETCDDGPLNSDSAPDACRANCLRARCGDGVIDTAELCDDGAGNSDTTADACRNTCVPARCGDNIIDSGESCDDGGLNSDTEANACRTTCVAAGCGDNVIDLAEACDNGNLNSDVIADCLYGERYCVVCSTACFNNLGITSYCGDGVVDTGEACDDGNDLTGDGCSEPSAGTPCVIEPYFVCESSDPSVCYRVIYVNAAAPGPVEDGLTWTTAFTRLADAIADVPAGVDTEIWVAGGTYYPDEGVVVADGDRTATFWLDDGLGVYGGFVGGETRRDQRDVANLTVLNGDLNQDDGSTCSDNRTDNALTVVTVRGDATLDGFTVRGGNAYFLNSNDDTRGAGVDVRGAFRVVLGNLDLVENCAEEFAAGLMCEQTELTLSNVTVERNEAVLSGAGALVSYCSVTSTNMLFQDNSSLNYAAGLHILGGSAAMSDTTFSSNSATEMSGMVVEFSDVSFAGLVASDNTGTSAMRIVRSFADISNLELSSNSGVGMQVHTGTTVISGAAVTANAGGGIVCDAGELYVEDGVFEQNTAATGGGLFATNTITIPCTATLVRSTFVDNSATDGLAGGGAISSLNSQLDLRECSFFGNSATTGGAIRSALLGAFVPRLTGSNLVFSGNTAAGNGGAIANVDGLVLITNSSFTANSAGAPGGAIFTGVLFTTAAASTVHNCLLWNNAPSAVAQAGAGTSTVTSSITDAGPNPLFVNPTGIDGVAGTADDDLRLSSSSPAIDAGNNDVVAAGSVTDFDGQPRIVDIPSVADTGSGSGPPYVDLGAFEAQP